MQIETKNCTPIHPIVLEKKLNCKSNQIGIKFVASVFFAVLHASSKFITLLAPNLSFSKSVKHFLRENIAGGLSGDSLSSFLELQSRKINNRMRPKLT